MAYQRQAAFNLPMNIKSLSSSNNSIIPSATLRSPIAIPQKRSATGLSDGQRAAKRPELRDPDADVILETQRFLGFLKDYLDTGIAEIQDPPIKAQVQAASLLYENILRQGDNPFNKDIYNFSCKDVSRIIETIFRSTPASFPTSKNLSNSNHAEHDFTDMLGPLVHELVSSRDFIVELGGEVAGRDVKLSPSEFGKRNAWHSMQDSPSAILCHQPVSNRPHLPLEVMHPAFYEFMKETDFLPSELSFFHQIAIDLTTQLAAPLDTEPERVTNIISVLKRMFPDETPFKWSQEKTFDSTRVDLIYQKAFPEDHLRRSRALKTQPNFTNLIAIEIKLEEGKSGDPFLQISRMYDIIIKRNPNYCETGAPMFLITMAGMSLRYLSL